MTTVTTGLGDLLARLGQLWLLPFVDVSVKGVLLLAVAGAAALVFRRASAATRHLIWTLGLLALLVLPALRLATPEWRVSLPVTSAVASFSSGETALVRPRLQRSPEPESAVGDPAEEVRPEGEPAPGKPVTPVGAGLPTEGPLLQGAADGATGSRELKAEKGGGLGPGAPGWPGALFALWLLVAVGLLARLAGGFLRVKALARTGEPVTDPDILDRVRSLSERLGLGREVRVLAASRAPVPMTWGVRRPVLLLPREVGRWHGTRLEHVLLHELAHVKRRDHLAQVLTEITLALHWMNPLAWLAAFRARAEREQACDDRVLVAGCRPSGYARDLLEVARSLRSPGSAGLVTTAMARSSGLGQRLRRILDSGRCRRGPGGVGTALSGVVALGVVLPLAALAPSRPAVAGPGEAESVRYRPEGARGEAMPESRQASGPVAPVQEICPFRLGGPQSTSIDTNDHRTRAEWSTDDCWVKVEIRGRVEFGADDRTVARIPPGGLFELEEEGPGTRRLVRMESGPDGAPAVEYRVDGDQRSFDQEGRDWLASILPELFRHTAINAEARARRILDRGGPDGLLREIERIESDHVARTYFEHLLALADLDEGEVREVLRIAGDRLDSDHHRAELLLTVVQEKGLSPGLRDAYLDAARGIDSDHHHRRVLEGFLDRDTLTPARLARVLGMTRRIESDHHLAEVLIRVLEGHRLEGEATEAFRRAAGSIDSDHHLRRTLESALRSPAIAGARPGLIVELAREIGSDHHRAELLVQVAGRVRLQGDLRDAYLRAAEEIDSRTHRDRALAALARADAI